jgi:hypothetical protein
MNKEELMHLDISVQQQLINAIADEPECSLSTKIGPEGTLVADNLLYLQKAGVVGLGIGPPAEDGSRYVLATFTTAGQVFVKDQFGQEVILKAKIQERISQQLELTVEKRQSIRYALEKLPWGPHTHVGLRLVDLGFSSDAEARTAAVEYLKGL